MGLVDQFHTGDSWIFFVAILVVSILVMVFLGKMNKIVIDWTYEPIVAIPEKYQKNPLVQKWFEITRGFNYDVQLDKSKGETLGKCHTDPTPHTKTRTDFLVSGWGFAHFLQHFGIAFLCPKLVPVSCMIGIAWEIIETYYNMHCALDIVWNLCGSLCGLLFRSFIFPPTLTQ